MEAVLVANKISKEDGPGFTINARFTMDNAYGMDKGRIPVFR